MEFCSSTDWCKFSFSAAPKALSKDRSQELTVLNASGNEGRCWLSWGLQNFVQLTLLRPGWWKMDLLICMRVQMWWPYFCHVAIVELRKGISLLNVLNHNAPLLHYSAKHCQNHPQSADPYKVIRKDKLKFRVCKSVHHHTFNWINQRDAANFSSLLLVF